ncbi:MAG: cysteine desulfurase family protein [bacterium]|nr:cysteine desulfurase family protein [bacterium]
MNRIYLDNSATTMVAPEVIEKITQINSKYYGNPSSVHTIGTDARHVVDEARREIADFFGSTPEEIIFTSGGSESDNLAIKGIVQSVIAISRSEEAIYHERLPRLEAPMARNDNAPKPHIITSATEHHAVLYTIEDLEQAGVIEATYIKPDKDGFISPESVEKEIRENTVLVSLIYVNNETGVVTPIAEIGEMIEKVNQHRETPSVSPLKMGRIAFHTDAVQAVEFMPVDVDELKVDLLTFTTHKIHGPKGIGGLYVRWGVKLAPQITGGSQEFRLRAGTENVAGISALAEALKLVHSTQYTVLSKVEVLRDKLIKGIQDNIPDTILNGAGAKRAPHIANISFMNAEGEAIILNLDFLGIAVSSGSACTSRTLEPSHVLTAMGIPPEKCHGAIRFSLSRYTTEAEIDKVLEVLPAIIEKLKAIEDYKSKQVSAKG